MTKKATPDLKHNTKLANDEHRQVIEASGAGLGHAIAAGVALRACKDAVGHGQWEKWLGENCPDVSLETARLYMRLASKAPEIEKAAEQNGNAVADLSIRGARKLISKPGTKRPTRKSPGSPDIKAT